MMAPTLYSTAIQVLVAALRPAPPFSWAFRKLGYTSWVPWLIQLNAVISRIR